MWINSGYGRIQHFVRSIVGEIAYLACGDKHIIRNAKFTEKPNKAPMCLRCRCALCKTDLLQAEESK